MKKIIFSVLLLVSLTLSLCGCGKAQDAVAQGNGVRQYSGIVPWGAGGGTDSLMRPLSRLAEKELSSSIVVQNMTGGTGSIGAQYVLDAEADGKTLLMAAENPALYDVLEIAPFTYYNFTCVYLVGDEIVGIVVAADSPYQTFPELVNAMLAAPDTLRMSTTGKGGLPWEVGAFLTDITGVTYQQIPYDSDATARTAVLNGECDFTVCKLQSGLADAQAGTLRFLTLLSDEPEDALSDVSLITEDYPDFAKYLPWGPFYGVFVKSGTDAKTVETLAEGFARAGSSEEYTELLSSLHVRPLGYTGEKAAEYIESWRRNTVEALFASGALEK